MMFKSGKIETPMLGVVNLDASVTDRDLYDYFSNVDDLTVIWAEVSKDRKTGKSLREGHVCFYNHQDAASAIDAFNWTKLKGRSIIVTPSTFTYNQVTVKIYFNAEDCDVEAFLDKSFRTFGKILLITLYTDDNANLYGYIVFGSLQSAAKAASALQREGFAHCNLHYGGKHLVDPHVPLKLVDPTNSFFPPKQPPSPGVNVLVDNLNFFVNERDLTEWFLPYGTVSFCQVRHKPDLSNGSGRLTFTTLEEATEAIAAMDGQVIRGCPIQVSLEGGASCC
ncbi:hypothetical protein POM88_020643 [Heracleum sosnowskyi]|uniref:RRM domain-containing protein n=1 Tax=Heracleum sosnowskyi TaxID=360622 RepID=A0AAD8MT28_9APIA|nr:hypothetical protein POM88_020643 [Heracleum sosnowskyi]